MVEFDLLSMNYTPAIIVVVVGLVIAFIGMLMIDRGEVISVVAIVVGVVTLVGGAYIGVNKNTTSGMERLEAALGKETVSRVIIESIPNDEQTSTSSSYIGYDYDKNSSFDFNLKNIQTQVTFKCTVSTSSDNKHYIGCQNDPQTANGSYVSPSEALDTSTVLTTTSK